MRSPADANDAAVREPGNVRPTAADQRRIDLMQKGAQRMLILTRRVGERVMIGDDVAVTVLGMRSNQVRVGVEAPREISVHREEVYARIRKERIAAVAAAAEDAK